MGIQQVKFGDLLKPIAIERYRGSVKSPDIGSVISKNIQVSTMHFVEGMGYIYCFGGDCCRDEGLPQVRYVLPFLVYTIENAVQLKYGTPVFLKYLSLGKEAYQLLILKDAVSKDLTHKDMYVSCSDESYQKLSFEIIGGSKWRENSEILAEVKSLFSEYQSLIGGSLARTLTEESYKRLKGRVKKGDFIEAPRSAISSSKAPLSSPLGNVEEIAEASVGDEKAALVLEKDFDLESLLEG